MEGSVYFPLGTYCIKTGAPSQVYNSHKKFYLMKGESKDGPFCDAKTCQGVITTLKKEVRVFSTQYKGKGWDPELKSFFSLTIKDATYVGYKKGLISEYKPGGFIEVTSHGATSMSKISQVFFHESWHGVGKPDHPNTPWDKGYSEWHGAAMKQERFF